MFLVKKMIILRSLGAEGRGIVKLESLNGVVSGQLSVYELKNADLRLGIRLGYGRLFEYETGGFNYSFRLEDGLDLAERIECVLSDNKTLKPLLAGSSDGKLPDIPRLTELFTANAVKDAPVISTPVEAAAKAMPISPAPEAAPHIKTEPPKEDFFQTIKPQLDELFKCYPADKELMKSVPDSKWARINYEGNDYYVVGILYNGKRATHICYGVPGVYSVRPREPAEWLPLDYSDPEGRGYWTIFQDAYTGKTL